MGEIDANFITSMHLILLRLLSNAKKTLKTYSSSLFKSLIR